MTAFVRGVIAFSKASGVKMKPLSAVQSTETGVPPHRLTMGA